MPIEQEGFLTWNSMQAMETVKEKKLLARILGFDKRLFLRTNDKKEAFLPILLYVPPYSTYLIITAFFMLRQVQSI